MSNYFDGLIRASDLATGSYPRMTADHGITEIDIQHDAPLVAKPAATPMETAPAVADPSATKPRQSGTDIPSPLAATTPAPVTLEPATRAPAASIGDKVEEMVSTDSPPAPSEPSMRPQSDSQDLGQAMRHAALRWVAADGPSPSALTEIEIAPEPTPPIPAQELTTHEITPPTRPAMSPPEAEPTPDTTTRPPEAPIPLRVAPIRHVESTDPPPPWASATRRPASRDETVEISIGAIHLRVDAPPPQTVVQAPAPTPRPPADRPPPRSALTRRALRRL